MWRLEEKVAYVEYLQTRMSCHLPNIDCTTYYSGIYVDMTMQKKNGCTEIYRDFEIRYIEV